VKQIIFIKKSYFIFLITVLLSTLSLAQSNAPRFSAGVMALFGTGKMGNGLADAPDRDMTFTPIDLFLGVNIKKFRLGLNYDYMMVGQTTDPTTVANTNVSGTGAAPGIRLEYYDGKTSAGLVYRLSNTYNLDKITFSGNKAVYTGTGGLTIQFTRQIRNKIGLVLDYTTETFSDSLTTGKVKWSRMGLGIVYSNFTGK